MGRSGFLAATHIVTIVLPFILAAFIGRSTHTYAQRLFVAVIFIGVGFQGFSAGLQQIFQGETIAEYLNWAYSPFVHELGAMNLAFGILGLLAPWRSRGWQVATALGYGFFLFYAAIGHVIDLFDGNVSLGNFGPTLWSDFLIPILLAVTAYLTRGGRGNKLPHTTTG